MKRKSDELTSLSGDGRAARSEKSSDYQNMIFVEEETNAVPLGTHHGGSMHTYMSHKVQKLQELHQRSNDEIVSTIFRDCTVHVNGATTPSLPDIRRLVTMHGGHFAAYPVPSLTHIVCDHFTDAQLKREMNKSKASSGPPQKKIMYIQAKWVVDSIKRKVRLPESEYLPRGLKDRFGSSIKDMLDNNTSSRKQGAHNSNSSWNPSSSSSSSSSRSLFHNGRKSVLDIVDLCSPADIVDAEQQQEHINKFDSLDRTDNHHCNEFNLDVLTSSQQDFVFAVPDELRQEVIVQFRHNANSTVISHETSINSMVGLQSQVSESVQATQPEVANGAVENDDQLCMQSYSLQRIQEAINYIHGYIDENNDGLFTLNNYRRERMMQNRLESWVQQQFLHSNGGTSDNDASLSLQIVDGYAIWLLHGDQLQQLKWLMRVIEKQLVGSGQCTQQLLQKIHGMVIKQHGCKIHF